jgi:hypothetical protein
MPLKKETAKDADGEDQYGKSQQTSTSADEANEAMQAQSTPFPGMQYPSTTWGLDADTYRPVVVAENMIGVAMYELVGCLAIANTTRR